MTVKVAAGALSVGSFSIGGGGGGGGGTGLQGRDMAGLVLGTAGLFRLFMGRQTGTTASPKHAQSKASNVPELAHAGASATISGGSGLYSTGDQWWATNLPGVMIGQLPYPRGKSIHFQRYAAHAPIQLDQTVSAGGALNGMYMNGFPGGAGTFVYGPTGLTYTNTGLTRISNMVTQGALTGVQAGTGTLPQAFANQAYVWPSTRTTSDVSMDLGVTPDWTQSFVIETVVRLSDARTLGIGGTGMGFVNGDATINANGQVTAAGTTVPTASRRTICVFGAAKATPAVGDLVYILIDPSPTNAYQTGNVRFGFGSGREVVINDAIEIGRATYIAAQWNASTGQATLWVAGRGQSMQTVGPTTITGPTGAATGAAAKVAALTATAAVAGGVPDGSPGGAGTLYSGEFFWGMTALYGLGQAGHVPWTTPTATAHWVETGLDTTGNPINFGRSYGDPASYHVKPKSPDMALNTVPTDKGQSSTVQKAADMCAMYDQNAAPFSYQWATPTCSLYVVDETVPEVEVDVWPDGEYWNLMAGTRMGVPLPPGAVASAGTDLVLAVYRPATDEWWEFWRLTRPEYNHPSNVVTTNQGSTALRNKGNRVYNSGLGGWGTDLSRCIGAWEYDNSMHVWGSIGWGGAASGIPYFLGASRITDLIAGDLPYAIHHSLAINEKSPRVKLTVAIPSGTVFGGTAADKITVDTASGWPSSGTLSFPTGSVPLKFGADSFTYTGIITNADGTMSYTGVTGTATATYAIGTISVASTVNGTWQAHNRFDDVAPRDARPFPAVKDDTNGIRWDQASSHVGEGDVMVFPATVNFDATLPALPATGIPQGWAAKRAVDLNGTQDVLNKMHAKAIQRYGLVCRDQGGGMYCEDHWEYCKVNGFSPYDNAIPVTTITSVIDANTLEVAQLGVFSTGFNSGGGTSGNFEQGHGYIPRLGVQFLYFGTTTTPTNRVTVIFPTGFNTATINAGDFLITESKNGRTAFFALATGAGTYRALYPASVSAPAGTPIFGTGSAASSSRIPYDLLLTASNNQILQESPGPYIFSNGSTVTTVQGGETAPRSTKALAGGASTPAHVASALTFSKTVGVGTAIVRTAPTVANPSGLAYAMNATVCIANAWSGRVTLRVTNTGANPVWVRDTNYVTTGNGTRINPGDPAYIRSNYRGEQYATVGTGGATTVLVEELPT